MALTDAEKSKSYRQRKREQIGEIAFKQLEHEAYLRRKDRLKAERDTKRHRANGNTLNAYHVYRAALRAINMTAPGHVPYEALSSLNDDARRRLAMGIAQSMLELGYISDKREMEVKKTLLKLQTPVGTQFFTSVLTQLRGEKRLVWEYVYLLLYFYDESKIQTLEIMSAEINVNGYSILEALHDFVEMNIITISDKTDKSVLAIVESPDAPTQRTLEAISTKPVILKRNKGWN